jgi:uncharacterized protein (TIGR02246 family)
MPEEAGGVDTVRKPALRIARIRVWHLLCIVLLVVSACTALPREAPLSNFDPAEIRQAERALEAALSSDDPLAWVDHYTEDAVFVAPGAPAVQGREALLRMAKAMRPLSAVQMQDLKTDGSGTMAAVYGRASWINAAGTPTQSTTNVRLVIVWRKGGDGRWRIAQELLHPEPASK